VSARVHVRVRVRFQVTHIAIRTALDRARKEAADLAREVVHASGGARISSIDEEVDGGDDDGQEDFGRLVP
jgi:hypothetical protein